MIPVALALVVATMPASQAWAGAGKVPEDVDVELAERLRVLRRDEYRQTDQLWLPLIQEAMAARRIRPRPGISPDALVALMHALYDGALLRSALEPDLLPPELVATAMFELGLVLSEPGSFHADPRRPDDDPHNTFDAIVQAAEARWRRGEPVGVATPELSADVAVPTDVIGLLFPSDTDLADSVLRSVVMSSTSPNPLAPTGLTVAHVREVLGRFSAAAAELPAVIDLLAVKPVRGTRFLDVLEQDLVALLRAATVPVPQPERTAGQLLGLCLAGPAAWMGVEAILDVLVLE